ncbi:hypothetical protein [Pelagovum pacificum]|uniref:Uncharacterized protein n=1 Tax=Pelagovum pacificum TaxID=2588711 RepID=A0A5C5GG05_9RHOB|nr:hypothetical protein [Pelagovum pacificum]QQA43952.1 hypothetical protein I8N54_05070 [Pelagovum pacificum]TNY32919.1 hypothetical protein FHY64_06480 [Pelagovum pacificum]
MSAFSVAVNTMFTGPHHAESATYTPQVGDPVACRVIRRAPTEDFGIGRGRVSVAGVTFLVRKSEVASPRAGDVITAAGEQRTVDGSPELDPKGLIWTIDTRPGPTS